METYRAYTTIDQVLDLTGEAVNDAHCRAATAIIKNYTGVEWDKVHTFTNKVYSGNGTEWLDLGIYPIISVSSVRVNNTVLASGEYQLPSEHGDADGYLRNENTWEVGTANIKVTFTYGYSEVPQLVRDIAARIAALLKNESFSGVASESLDAYSVSYMTNKDSTTEATINNLLKRLPSTSGISSVGQSGSFDVLNSRERMYSNGGYNI